MSNLSSKPKTTIIISNIQKDIDFKQLSAEIKAKVYQNEEIKANNDLIEYFSELPSLSRIVIVLANELLSLKIFTLIKDSIIVKFNWDNKKTIQINLTETLIRKKSNSFSSLDTSDIDQFLSDEHNKIDHIESSTLYKEPKPAKKSASYNELPKLNIQTEISPIDTDINDSSLNTEAAIYFDNKPRKRSESKVLYSPANSLSINNSDISGNNSPSPLSPVITLDDFDFDFKTQTEPQEKS
ncbi:Rcn2p ASCRUDRAFT_88382 [Ascoidea rubescens DSM 1968]|uniref:Uncharacterized protein n=1 Tax=Ascoidea rubescens DSM 1968 TaxID=1344418 RepID=A0A1D2V9D8_9ASCO|nr:hypothetical protein ASCRUDRAFT_88382 [Ascoidea rubescens DSM 1968]ODV58264.1 hypothetical protein ASCRUDRAFT_88382 [Ascoidea rubescens DSM 1968]